MKNPTLVVCRTEVVFAKGPLQTAGMATTSATEATPEQLKRLGSAVKARRTGKRWSHAKVIEQGGPSTTTLTNIEAFADASLDELAKGDPATPQLGTLEKLDNGLKWVLGSAEAVLWDGAEPKIRDESERPIPLGPVQSGPQSGGGMLRRLVAIRDEIDVMIEDMREQ